MGFTGSLSEKFIGPLKHAAPPAHMEKRISLAPMMDKTNSLFRRFIRLLYPEIFLYTEMIGTDAILRGDTEHLLGFNPSEHPIALQIGTHLPEEAYRAVKAAEEWNYDEYNLNVGCPSGRVQHRQIGAVLMADPQRVADILAAMQEAAPKPVTLKHRLGISQPSAGIDLCSPDDLYSFLEITAPRSRRLIIHARVALLDGLNPKQNRNIPPLHYEAVYQVQRDFPGIPVELNGGIRSAADLADVLPRVSGAMIGRLSYEDTWTLKSFLPNSSTISAPSEAVRAYRQMIAESDSSPSQLWMLLSLWHNKPGAGAWRRLLSPPHSPQMKTDPKSALQELLREAEQFLKERESEFKSVSPD